MPNNICPSQDFLKPETIKYIIECLKNGETDKLPPPPIVRQDKRGNYIAVDGHNLLAVSAFLNRETEVHLARNADDGLPETNPANRARNADLADKFERCLVECDRLEAAGIRSFDDLIARNTVLFEQAKVIDG